MKIHALVLAFCIALPALAQAKGVPYAVGSFEKAQQSAKQDASKHVLVFYTHEL